MDAPPAAHADTAALYAEHVAALRRRAETLLAATGHDGMVIAAGPLRTAFLDDATYPFRANPHFVWWVPLPDLPDAFIVVRPGEIPHLFHPQADDYWHVPPAPPAGFWTDQFRITLLRGPDDIPRMPRRHVLLGDDPALAERLGVDDINPHQWLAPLHFARAVKSDYETKMSWQANLRAVRGHLQAETLFREGASEFDIHLGYLRASSQTDNEAPYPGIVALNEHAAVLHYQHRDRETPKQHHSLLIDAGATCAGYTSDITRTHAASGSGFADLIARLDEAQQALIADIGPGMSYTDLHLQMHHRLAQLLTDAGLVRGSAEGAVANGVTRTFFPHGLGHLLGLQTHDVGGHQATADGKTRPPPPEHPALRNTRPVQAGQLFTIEPGLYFIDRLLDELKARPAAAGTVDWQAVEGLRRYGGIRIEDNVLVSADGCHNLTRAAFAATSRTT